MKQINIYLAILCAIAMSLFSCNTKKTPTRDNIIEFDTIHSVQNYYWDNDSTQPSCNLKLTFIYPVSYDDKAILDSLQRIFVSCFFDETYGLYNPKDAVANYGKAYIENYKEDVKIFSENSDSHDDREEFFSYYETTSNQIIFNQADILAFQVTQSNYKGGASSYEFLKNYVINLKTGKLITEDDIFKPGYEKLLTPIFKDYLIKSNKVQSVNELEDLGYFGIDEMAPNDNFLLDTKGITYIFNKGEYSAYKLDAIKVFIPFNEIDLALKDDSPISQLITK